MWVHKHALGCKSIDADSVLTKEFNFCLCIFLIAIGAVIIVLGLYCVCSGAKGRRAYTMQEVQLVVLAGPRESEEEVPLGLKTHRGSFHFHFKSQKPIRIKTSMAKEGK